MPTPITFWARLPERKVAAIGIRVSQGVASHGFALNCDVDLGWYDRFVPCGIADAGVTSLTAELGRQVTVSDVLPLAERHLRDLLAWAPYAATPDYEPRPEPGRSPRIELLTPGRIAGRACVGSLGRGSVRVFVRRDDDITQRPRDPAHSPPGVALLAVVVRHRRVVVALEVDRSGRSPPVSTATSRSR